MGNCLKNFGFKKLKRPVTLLLVGLDNSGKTTAAKGIVGDSIENVAATVGFSPETLEYRGCEVTMYDLGGGPRIRAVWPKYFSEIHGVIFVIDSSDKARIEECHTVLEELLSHKKVSGKPVLVLANKQDIDGALDEIDIVENLKIEQIVNSNKCPTRVETCSAISLHKKKPDKPIADGFRWLIDTIVVHYKTLHKRIERDVEEEQQRLKEEAEKRNERIRLIREERERQEREAEAELANQSRRKDSDDESIVIIKQNPESFENPDEELITKLESVIEDAEATSPGISSALNNELEESPNSSTEAKELQELGFKSVSSLHSNTSSSSSGSFTHRAADNPSSVRKNSLSTHLIEVHPSPSDIHIDAPPPRAEISRSAAQTGVLLEDSPLRSSECVPMDSDDELFASLREEEEEEEAAAGVRELNRKNSVSHSYLVNGSAIAGIKEQIELEASLTRKPKRKNFLKRLHKTAPMTATSVSADFLSEEVAAGGQSGRIP